MSFYDPWTLGMTALPMSPQPLWAFDARSAANKAFAGAAHRGHDLETCQDAYEAAWKTVASKG